MSVNLSSTTPAAPASNTNVTFQTDGSGNISAYVPSSAQNLPGVNTTGLTANVAATTLLAVTTAGMYRVSGYIILTVAGSISSTLPSIVITWNDKDSTVAQTITLTPTNAGNTTATYQQATCIIDAQATTNIQYSTTGYASNAAGMTYALHLRIEAV